MSKVIPIVLAGGIGSRLWPLSQESHPKQFIKLFNGKSLFQKTLIRNKKFGKITVITTEAYKNIALEQSIDVNVEIELIIEPIRKNTASSCLVAALYYLKIENSFLLFLPTDHYINGEDEYHVLLEQAICSLKKHNFITVGIKPKSANPNFGYIKAGIQLTDNIYQVENFKEKPDQASTKQYIISDNYFWNSGIYLINSKYLLDRAQIIQPLLYSYVYDAYILGIKVENSFYLARKPYEKILPISFDHALVEHMQNLVLITASFGWHDLGSWDAICKLLINGRNNYCIGDVIFKTLINSYFNSNQKPHNKNPTPINNCITNRTNDNNPQNVKSTNYVVNSLDVKTRREKPHISTIAISNKLQDCKSFDCKGEINYTSNEPEIFLRQWGYYQILVNSNSYKIKELIIHPGRQLSMQYHLHRTEFWIVIKGIGEVIMGPNEKKLEKKIIKENDFVSVPIKEIHKIINIGEIDLELIETQVGAILEENDIVRLDEA